MITDNFYLYNSIFNSHKQILLLLLLSRFSRVRLCATPETAAHQAPLSLGSPVPGILQARTLEWVADIMLQQKYLTAKDVKVTEKREPYVQERYHHTRKQYFYCLQI